MFTFCPESQRTIGASINGERKYIRYTELLKEYKDEKFFNKTTSAISIFAGRFADERCEIVDEETEIILIARDYYVTKSDGFNKWRTYHTGVTFVINGEFVGEKIARDAKAAYKEFLKSREAK